MKVYMTYRNVDMTEGRGPMVPALCFLQRAHADEYIDAQPGVMGRRAKWSAEQHGDWSVKEVEVLEHSVIGAERQRKELKATALAKLTQLEREALGL